MMDKRQIIGEALAELVEQARTGGPKFRSVSWQREVNLAQRSSCRGEACHGAGLPAPGDGLGPRLAGYDSVQWIETSEDEAEISAAMESALSVAG